MKLFSELGLSDEILKAIDNLGFEQASPIQAEAIPALMEGADIVGQSQTGSGKTAAFGIPAIEKTDPKLRAVQVLILCPTRELAVQVSEEVHKLAQFKRGIHPLPIYGGQSYDRQLYGLRQGANIVIGTPGRVMDHMRRGTLRLDQVKLVVLDEADVMLDMGFRDDIETILKDTPKTRQTVFFSATMSPVIQQLIRTHAREPRQIKIEQKTVTVPTIEQVYYEVDRRFKVELLTRLIDIHDLKLGIIFCNTKRMVDDLVDHLNAQGYSADRLHGDMSQAQRDRVMNKFRKSGLEFLVATDVAARGIDVDDVQVVFNYDLPYDVEDYVHRIGRTGRAGRSGRAISFVGGKEVFQIRNIERYTGTRVQRGKPPTSDEVESARANVFIDKLRAVLKSGKFPRQDNIVELLLEEGHSTTDIASALLHLAQNDAPPTASRPQQQNFDDGSRGREDRRRADVPQSDHFRRRDDPRAVRPPRPPRTEDTAPRRADYARPVRIPEKKLSPAPVAPAPAPVAPAPAIEKPISAEAAAILEKPNRTNPVSAPTPKPPRASRPVPAEHTRLFISLGREDNITHADLTRLIQGNTGIAIPATLPVDIRERHTFIDVPTGQANAIATKMNRLRHNGKRLKAKLADSKKAPKPGSEGSAL